MVFVVEANKIRKKAPTNTAVNMTAATFITASESVKQYWIQFRDCARNNNEIHIKK